MLWACSNLLLGAVAGTYQAQGEAGPKENIRGPYYDLA